VTTTRFFDVSKTRLLVGTARPEAADMRVETGISREKLPGDVGASRFVTIKLITCGTVSVITGDAAEARWASRSWNIAGTGSRAAAYGVVRRTRTGRDG